MWDIIEPNDVDCVLLTRRGFPVDPAAEAELINGLLFLPSGLRGQVRYRGRSRSLADQPNPGDHGSFLAQLRGGVIEIIESLGDVEAFARNPSNHVEQNRRDDLRRLAEDGVLSQRNRVIGWLTNSRLRERTRRYYHALELGEGPVLALLRVAHPTQAGHGYHYVAIDPPARSCDAELPSPVYWFRFQEGVPQGRLQVVYHDIAARLLEIACDS